MEDKRVLMKVVWCNLFGVIFMGWFLCNYSHAVTGEFSPFREEIIDRDTSYLYQNTYTITNATTAFNKSGLEATLRDVWTAMVHALKMGDFTTALSYISPKSRPAYQTMFTALGNQLPIILATQKEFNLISVQERVAICKLLTVENGKTYSYEVIFIREDDGSWKIKEF